MDRIEKLIDSGDCYPVTIEIDLTNFCNHKCRCCVDPFHGNVIADRKFISSLLKELKEVGVKGIVLKGGGESIIHPQYEAIVEEIKAMGFDLGTVTNGSRLIEDSVSKALAKNADYVRVSFNGPTRQIYKKVHGVDQFEQITEGVKRLVKYRNGKYPLVGISFPFDSSTIEYVNDAISLVDELAADYILIRPFFYEEVGFPREMDCRQAREVREKLLKAARQYTGNKLISVGQFVSDYEYKEMDKNSTPGSSGRRAFSISRNNGIEHDIGKCYAHPLITAITADGNIWGCCNLRNYPEYSFGRIEYEKGISFKDIWNGTQRKEVRKKIDNAQCLGYCTHALTRYNSLIYYLSGCDKNHGSFL